MRRNREFRCGDVEMITQMGTQNIRVLMGQLLKGGFVKTSSKKNVPLSDKIFTVLNASSVVCPVKSPNKYVKRVDRQTNERRITDDD